MEYRQLPPDAPPPRLCLLVKDHPDQEYGFNFHFETSRGQYIGVVDPGSPAELAGLQFDDQVFAINGARVQEFTHHEAVAAIKQNPMQCELLVTSKDDAQWYRNHDIDVDMNLPNILRVCPEFYKLPLSHNWLRQSSADSFHATPVSRPFVTNDVKKTYSQDSASLNSCCDSVISSQNTFSEDDLATIKKRQTSGQTIPSAAKTSTTIKSDKGNALMNAPPARLSHLEKKLPTDEYGFNLHVETGKGHFIGAVDKGGIADEAGLEMGQRIVGVNNKLILPDTPHKDVVGLIKKDPLYTVLLVVSEEVDRWYTEHNVAFSFSNSILYNQKAPPPNRQVSIESNNRNVKDKRAVSEGTTIQHSLNTLRKAEAQVYNELAMWHAEEKIFARTPELPPIPLERIFATLPEDLRNSLLTLVPESEVLVDATAQTDQLTPASSAQYYNEKAIADRIAKKICELQLTVSNDTNNNAEFESTKHNDDNGVRTPPEPSEILESPTLHTDKQSFNNEAEEIDRIFQDINDMTSAKSVESLALSSGSDENLSVAVKPIENDNNVTPITRDLGPKQVPIAVAKPHEPFMYSSQNLRNQPILESSERKLNGNDIFNLSAKEARRALQHHKVDPRKQKLSIEQKHKLINNL